MLVDVALTVRLMDCRPKRRRPRSTVDIAPFVLHAHAGISYIQLRIS
jgi:hypothetical protein